MAVKLAADHPDVVGRLVIVSTPADEDQIDVPTMLWLATLPVVGPLFYALGRAARPVRRLWMRPFVADPDDLTDEVVDDAGRSTPAAVSKTLSIGRREISRGRLARQARIIKIPLLVVAGEQDQIVDPQSVGVWAGGVDRAEISLIDECGHLPMIERTAEFNAQILAFLTGDPRYLDYVPPTPATASYHRATTVGEKPRDQADPGGRPPKPPPHRTTRRTSPQAPPTSTRGDSGPKVVRKQNGRYPARTPASPPRRPPPAEAPGTTRAKARAHQTTTSSRTPRRPLRLARNPPRIRPRRTPRRRGRRLRRQPSARQQLQQFACQATLAQAVCCPSDLDRPPRRDDGHA